MGEILVELVDYLHRNVPMSRHMEIRAGMLTADTVSLCAPLEPNINDKRTMFAGTQASLCTLAGWTAVSFVCRDEGLDCDIAATEGHIEYLKPVDLAVAEATATLPGSPQKADFIDRLRDDGRGRITIEVTIGRDGGQAVVFRGRYFARRTTVLSDDRRGV